eukprot:m.74402 g.74402  ORF g.74402 m.74402 type:complete len:192 (-) comp14359_c0_seq4:745-1320(-)
MEGKDPFQSFFREAETIFRTLAEFEQAILQGSEQVQSEPSSRPSPRSESPRERVLSKDYLKEENPDSIDLSQVPGSKNKVYSDFSSASKSSNSTSPSTSSFQPFGWGTQLGRFSSTSITQQYNSTTGTTETIVQQSHHRDGQDYTCTQRFWQTADGRKQQEGECYDGQGRRLEPALEAQLLYGKLLCNRLA